MQNIITAFSKSKWIWCDKNCGENEYAEFIEQIIWEGSPLRIRLSVCGDYTLFINGQYIASNQYGDFGHYKIYDEIDISEYMQQGENTICFLVWYFGTYGMRYFTPTPGLIYEICNQSEIIAYSSSNTLSRKSKAYLSGEFKKISPQLGYSFSYDALKEDAWLQGCHTDFTLSDIISKNCTFHKRPVKKLDIMEIRKGIIISTEHHKAGYTYVADFGEEVVGLPSVSFESTQEQLLVISYGEILTNGHVNRIIEERDFSFDYGAKSGKNKYTNYMFRVAGRYMEINSEYPLDIEYIGILPQNYAVKAKQVMIENELDRRIYDICVNTLKLCMMEHYVDCPWREQCLYAYDARNQMLVGYVVLEGGNFDYARANLLLMSKDEREDGLLSICFPSGSDLTIPSFSLYFIIAVKEYLEYSGDISLGEAVFEKLERIMNIFVGNMEDGLVCKFKGENHWNFYDWSPYAESEIGRLEQGPDLLINAIMVLALNAYDIICRKIGKRNVYEGISEKIAETARKKYLNEATGLFFVADIEEKPTELANSLAILSGIAEHAKASFICEKLKDNSLIPCTLSMKIFKYDAMRMTDEKKYRSTILDEIRSTYRIMIDKGFTTVWETVESIDKLDEGWSLCHGWSAVPAYYYHILSQNELREI